VASLAGLIVALSVVVYETYKFMRPGLYSHERRYYLAAIPTSLVLAPVGVAAAEMTRTVDMTRAILVARLEATTRPTCDDVVENELNDLGPERRDYHTPEQGLISHGLHFFFPV
jgi:hypothetical protein